MLHFDISFAIHTAEAPNNR